MIDTVEVKVFETIWIIMSNQPVQSISTGKDTVKTTLVEAWSKVKKYPEFGPKTTTQVLATNHLQGVKIGVLTAMAFHPTTTVQVVEVALS